ncbi:YbaB/EbfC family nucleoid-associated protein [Micromonospora sp. B11E3]|uniref:YbaB/EbfC family nucleoid-associated protein n=1 Tax=Micromonospora sp. B11E3 TaxID=3153562 RepID=UPI00325EC450
MSGVHNNGQPLAPAQLRSAAADLRAVIQESVVTVTSPEHAVTVTVGPGNAVMELLLSQRAFRYDGDTLGAVIVETIREAGRQVDEALAERARELTRGRVDVAGLLGGVLPEPPAARTGGVPGASSGGTADDPGSEPLTALEAETEEKVRRLAEEADRQVAAYAEAQAELREITATAVSPYGGIAATVAAGGVLQGIQIDDEMLGHGANTLGALVLSTIQQATAQAAMLVAERVQRLTGPRLDIQEMVASYLPAELRDESPGASRHG